MRQVIRVCGDVRTGDHVPVDGAIHLVRLLNMEWFWITCNGLVAYRTREFKPVADEVTCLGCIADEAPAEPVDRGAGDPADRGGFT